MCMEEEREQGTRTGTRRPRSGLLADGLRGGLSRPWRQASCTASTAALHVLIGPRGETLATHSI
jgi:hypothetical protein